jgi:GT2 family glycosyltransferase
MITIVIPTYHRQAIAVETVQRLLPFGAPIIVVDQTPSAHEPLAALPIRLIHLDQPSIPHAMNVGVQAAETDVVLFLDDDIVPAPGLVDAHAEAHRREGVWAVAGQVLEPWQEPERIVQSKDDLQFRFNATEGRAVTNVMAGNLSVQRARFLQLGGFDENFTLAAYRFETDFAMRLAAAGGTIWFEPRASIRHLKLSSGGLRSYGDHRVSASPAHTAGDYYFALHHVPRFWRYAARRMRANVMTRFHATHPWTIPAKIIGELRGLMLAKELYRKGRRLMAVDEKVLGSSGPRENPANPRTREPEDPFS